MQTASKTRNTFLTAVYPPIICDYGLQIAVLMVGGRKEACALAALFLGIDCKNPASVALWLSPNPPSSIHLQYTLR
ncbi:hypothetical protein BDQ12DRAFT_694519 [Crucibulum laeve]|uniref:Uncharacterized protein n=1 Tax=Crucibulum laeve TaxID=68775 RepID=A0A5C3LEI1_9AGAR|nr:hypothetical protein BDQ12DRAFT_694519 [Crucibulum laeve]